jgi:hypothetical protein
MQAARGGAPAVTRKKIPPYGARAVRSSTHLRCPIRVKRANFCQGFIPRTNDDFGEGGAYPEVHVAQ